MSSETTSKISKVYPQLKSAWPIWTATLRESRSLSSSAHHYSWI